MVKRKPPVIAACNLSASNFNRACNTFDIPTHHTKYTTCHVMSYQPFVGSFRKAKKRCDHNEQVPSLAAALQSSSLAATIKAASRVRASAIDCNAVFRCSIVNDANLREAARVVLPNDTNDGDNTLVLVLADVTAASAIGWVVYGFLGSSQY
jgi:hypothetical protein